MGGLREWLIVMGWAASLLAVSWLARAGTHPPGPCLHQALAYAELARMAQIQADTAAALAAARSRITHAVDQRAAIEQRDALLADLDRLAARIQAGVLPAVSERLLRDLIDRYSNPEGPP